MNWRNMVMWNILNAERRWWKLIFAESGDKSIHFSLIVALKFAIVGLEIEGFLRRIKCGTLKDRILPVFLL